MPLSDAVPSARGAPVASRAVALPFRSGLRPARRIPRGLFAVCLLSIVGLSLLPWLQVGDGKTVPSFALFLGRFHPVILHVPIGLILLALILEHAHIRGLRQWIPQVPPETATFLMFCAALSALVSTVLGWMLSYSGGYDPVLLRRHFLAGLLTAIGANAALLLKLVSDAYPTSRVGAFAYQAVLLATGASLALAGHLGASITHGDDYLTEYAPTPVRRALGLPIRVDPADQPWKPLPARIVFADEVEPVLTERCVGCHSGQKAKGGLRLDAFAQVMKGGDSGAAVIAGEPAKSNLLRYIDLPESDSKHMPPKGKVQVNEDERLILGWWVEAGAPESTTVGELTLPDDVRLAMERNVPPAQREKQDAARREKVARLAAAVAGLQKRLPGTLRAVAPGEPDLEFSAAVDPGHFGDAQLRDLATVGDNLVLLDLSRTKVTDAGLAAVAKMPNLRRLQLQETGVTDAGLPSIKALPKLEVLNLFDTRVSDAGLAALTSLKTLRRLYLWRTAVTAGGEAKLGKLLPKLEIVAADPAPKLAVATPGSTPASAPGAPTPAKGPAPARVATPVPPTITARLAPGLAPAPPAGAQIAPVRAPVSPASTP
jgi:uncharacterized membrane protein